MHPPFTRIRTGLLCFTTQKW